MSDCGHERYFFKSELDNYYLRIPTVYLHSGRFRNGVKHRKYKKIFAAPHLNAIKTKKNCNQERNLRLLSTALSC